MKTLVFGSLNIDRTYSVESFVRAGETISAIKMEEFCGGKGFNQAIALRRAGSEVAFAGSIGADGQMLLDALDANGIDHRLVKKVAGATGHAVIQLDQKGQNCIIILAGANGEINEADVECTLSAYEAGDLIVLQNEISCVPHLLRAAHEKGMIVAFNPSPYNEKITQCNLAYVDYLLVNEVEGAAMTETDNPSDMLDRLCARYPHMNVVLTLGERGSVYQDRQGQRLSCGIHRVKAVDTTAAGDTFTGYFLSGMMMHGNAAKALQAASVAAGIAVSRKGAEPSIPRMEEVQVPL